jgi:hypothetical protein
VLNIQVFYGATKNDPDYVQVTIQNIGVMPVSDFWVDLYFDPKAPPTTGKIWPDLCKYGKAWYVSELLYPGGVLVLDTRAADNPEAPGARYSYWPEELPTKKHELWAMADSYWKPLGLVSELNEDNNIFGPITYNKASATSTGPASIVPGTTPTPEP